MSKLFKFLWRALLEHARAVDGSKAASRSQHIAKDSGIIEISIFSEFMVDLKLSDGGVVLLVVLLYFNYTEKIYVC